MYRLLFLLLTSPLYSQNIDYTTYNRFIEMQNDTVVSDINGEFVFALISPDQFRITHKSKLYINLHARLFGKSEDTLLYIVNPNTFIYLNDDYLLFVDSASNTKRYFTKRL